MPATPIVLPHEEIFTAYEGLDTSQFTKFTGENFNLPHEQLLENIEYLRDYLQTGDFDGGIYKYNSHVNYEPSDLVKYNNSLYVCVKQNGEHSVNGVQYPSIDDEDNLEFWKNLSKSVIITDDTSDPNSFYFVFNSYVSPVTNHYTSVTELHIRVYYFTQLMITNQPSDHGILIHIPYDRSDPSKSLQIWFDMNTMGMLLYRLGDTDPFDKFISYYE